jgi:putative membrane protein
MRHLFATVSTLSLLAMAPGGALAQDYGLQGQNYGHPGQNMVPGPSSMPSPDMMQSQNTGPDQMYGGGANGMAGPPPGMMGPNGGPPPGMMGPNGGPPPGMMMGPNGGPGQGMMSGQNMMGPPQNTQGPNGGMNPRQMRQVNAQDRRFVEQATSAGLAEVKAANMALHRSVSPAVREFGRWMITDHTLLDDMLTHFAQRAGVAVPDRMDDKDQTAYDKLDQYKNEVEFDLHYVADQVDAHKAAIELFKEEAQSGANPGLRWLAHKMQPMLTQHLAEAQELRSLPGSATEHEAHATAPSVPMAEEKKASAKQEGSTAVRQSVSREGVERIEKEGK